VNKKINLYLISVISTYLWKSATEAIIHNSLPLHSVHDTVNEQNI